MEGDVIWDSISQLDFYLEDGSTLTGAIYDDESYAGNGGDGYCSVYLSTDSTWTVTGDNTVTNLYSEGTIMDESGKTVSIVVPTAPFMSPATAPTPLPFPAIPALPTSPVPLPRISGKIISWKNRRPLRN